MSENAAQRLSDDEILARGSSVSQARSRSHTTEIPTFILAGHETTSTAVTWTLFQLAQRPALQAELRAELRSLPLPLAAKDNAPLDADTLAALDRLPLLDAVVRETLRANAPVQNAGRVATEDASIPLARPFIGRDGVLHDEVRVRKGDLITIPILSIHRSEELWGPDAREWKCVHGPPPCSRGLLIYCTLRPERWLAGGAPASTHTVPGMWSHLLAFLGGSHACIGYRFSLLEYVARASYVPSRR
jgi:cytochrome P450